MKVLVTGVSGFIGSRVTRALIDAGHEVMGLAIPGDNLWRLQGVVEKIELFRGELQNILSLRDTLRAMRPQVCIHLAWYAEPGKYLNAKDNLGSLSGSLDLLQELSECGCEQVIGAGTCAEYEMKSECLSENDRTKPETLYAASKLSFQMLGEQLAAQLGIRFAWGRIFYLYGPYENIGRLVPSAILSLQKSEVFRVSPGDQIRDYLHVDDVANAFVSLINHRATGIYNICSAEPVTVKYLLDTIGRLVGGSELLLYGALPYREWEPMYICGNNGRLKSIGWSPRFDLQAGLEDTIDWWERHLEIR